MPLSGTTLVRVVCYVLSEHDEMRLAGLVMLFVNIIHIFELNGVSQLILIFTLSKPFTRNDFNIASQEC